MLRRRKRMTTASLESAQIAGPESIAWLMERFTRQFVRPIQPPEPPRG
jgi:hypothetical protein